MSINLFVALQDFCSRENIILLPMPESVGISGCARVSVTGKYINYKQTGREWEQSNIIAHEVAHHILGHFHPDCTLLPEQKELEAQIVSSVLIGLNLYSELARNCSVIRKESAPIVPDDLLPCPFCGYEAELHHTGMFGCKAAMVRCTHCRIGTIPIAEGAAMIYRGEENKHISIDEAEKESVRQWNTRCFSSDYVRRYKRKCCD